MEHSRNYIDEETQPGVCNFGALSYFLCVAPYVSRGRRMLYALNRNS